MSSQEWIKCEERMPAPDVDVLVSYTPLGQEKPIVLGAFLNKAFEDMDHLFWFNGKGEAMRGVVSHWMPMIPLGFQAYPISHGTHIIQYHDETFVWYDEAAMQGGVTYSLEQAQRELKKYGEYLNTPTPDPSWFAPITAKGYEPGEIPHHFNDLNRFAEDLLEQNEAMRAAIVLMNKELGPTIAESREINKMTAERLAPGEGRLTLDVLWKSGSSMVSTTITEEQYAAVVKIVIPVAAEVSEGFHAAVKPVCECPPGTRNITEGGHFPACTACKRRLK